MIDAKIYLAVQGKVFQERSTHIGNNLKFDLWGAVGLPGFLSDVDEASPIHEKIEADIDEAN